MNDRELLELAAKAVQLPECGWMGPAFMYVKENRFTDWNPLNDDGDALRLAVKLNLHIAIECESAGCVSVEWAMGENTCPDREAVEPAPTSGDDYAATRRAIVRAAAEIGKDMP